MTDSRVNGLNCAAVLSHFARHIVSTALAKQRLGDVFGIRIGLDYGERDKVLWGAYGIAGADEVTATSFHVDMAAKLQHAAGRNQVMLGAALVDAIDFPHELLDQKRAERNGESVFVPFVEPNHTDSHGRPINYRQHILNVDEYLRCTGLAQEARIITPTGPRPVRAVAEVYDEGRRTLLGEYRAASRVLAKDQSLKFRLAMPSMPRLPYTVKCAVENHGAEAWTANPEDGDAHQTDPPIVVRTAEEHRNFAHWEGTRYRGLHYMTIDVASEGRIEYRTRFGVFVA